MSVAVVVVDAEEVGPVSEAGDRCALTAVPTDRPGVTVVPTDRPGVTEVPTGRQGVTAVLTDRPGVMVVPTGHPDVTAALIGCRGENRGAPAAAHCVTGRCQQSEVLCR